MPDVSFVATFYNKADFIPNVTQAIFAQKDLGDCEYIFVDDGSTDDSLAILQDCARGHENVKIISQKNAGPALATNVAIDAVTKPFIKFCDGDDILHPRATIELYKALEQFDVGLAWSLGEVVPANSDKMTAPDLPLSDDVPSLLKNPIERALKMAFFNLTCVLARTDTVRSAGACDPRIFVQDYSFALRLAHLTDFVLVPSILNWCPTIENPENRASQMGEGSQCLHDLNAALAYFILDHPDMDSTVRTKMFQRAAGRAWKWAKRQENATYFSKDFMRYLGAKLAPNFGNVFERTIATCASFHPERGIRIPRQSDG
ncbi:glycosyltransferase family 2 protein [Thalassospira australica]|uniref:glycosyltransferase family 2 protein n=1 Tax=Thalassospira australica TaxID=1528106 RepID=UPI00051A1553|nr:glycosyltransferase family 2 protein [Thalassospira australica]